MPMAESSRPEIDNVFIRITDLPRAQRLADRFTHLSWPREYARQVVPQLDDMLHGCEYYWVAAQTEYSTDVMFKSSAGLRELCSRLLSHSTLCFGAQEVMNSLGCKLVANFQGEVGSFEIPMRPTAIAWGHLDRAPAAWNGLTVGAAAQSGAIIGARYGVRQVKPMAFT
ncbi:MAG: hypothetical protein U1E90_06005 [Burkholderiaceae bacterium]